MLENGKFFYQHSKDEVKYYFKNITSNGKFVTVQVTAKGKSGGIIEAELKFDSEALINLSTDDFEGNFKTCLSEVTIFSICGLKCNLYSEIEGLLNEQIILPELIEKPLVATRELSTAGYLKFPSFIGHN